MRQHPRGKTFAVFADILLRAGNVRALGKESEEVMADLDESIRAIQGRR